VKILAGDIGGTKVHLGLLDAAPAVPVLLRAETYASRSADRLEPLVAMFLETVLETSGSDPPEATGGAGEAGIVAACFGVAGPVIAGTCRATNLPWELSEAAIAARFGWSRVALVNDLVAMASAVAALHERGDGLLDLTRVPGDPGGTRVVLAPGTGLGQALLVAVDGRWVPVASEGGHTDLAPRTEVEIELLRYLEQRHGHASYERVVSGTGLAEVMRFLLGSRGLEPPPWLAVADPDAPGEAIGRAALAPEPDPLAAEAMSIFVRCLAGAAGNLALTAMATGGVYLGGGIPPKILPLLCDGAFLRAFTDKGRFSGLLETIPVRVMLDQRAALLGAACLARDLVGRAGAGPGAGAS
jgi:glucokinase